jgi:hypothetical protein
MEKRYQGEVTVGRVPGPHVGMVTGVCGRFIAGRIDAHLSEQEGPKGD